MGLRKWAAESRAARKKEFFTHVESDIKKLYNEGKKITSENVPKGMNSYERHLLIPLYSNEFFLDTLLYYLEQSREHRQLPAYVLPRHYGDAIDGVLIHEIIKRFEALLEKERKA